MRRARALFAPANAPGSAGCTYTASPSVCTRGEVLQSNQHTNHTRIKARE